MGKRPFHTMKPDQVEELAKRAPIRLRIARVANHLTQAAIARELDITRGRWSQFEKGQRLLNWQLAGKIAVICKVDVNYLLFGYDFDIDKDMRDRLKMAEEMLRAQKEIPATDGQHLYRARGG